MQELSFPLKVHVRRNGKRVIFVAHEHLGRHQKAIRAKQDDTRYFVNWIRATFPDLPTEYRSTNNTMYRWNAAERHFVAYDVTPAEFIMIKLAFKFKTIKVAFAKKKKWLSGSTWTWQGYKKTRYYGEVYTPGYLRRCNVHPSAELQKRMAKNPSKYRKLTRNRQRHKRA
jgi:hypothetical protein